jgi:hypothetical protein
VIPELLEEQNSGGRNMFCAPLCSKNYEKGP